METSIHIDLSDGKTIAHEWSRANQLTVLSKLKYGHKMAKKAMATKSQLGSDSQLVSYKCIKPLMFDNLISRSLVSESLNVFQSIQRVSMKCEALSRNESIKASRKYRSVIHCCYSNLRNNAFNDQQSILQLSDMYYHMEIVWNLCEILYMDIHRTGFLLNQLVSWIRWHFTKTVSMAETVISVDFPHIHELYWDVIIRYVLRGDNDSARRFIKLNPDSRNKEEFIAIRELLKKMPMISNNQMLHEFYLRWQTWNEECIQCLNDGIFDGNDKLRLIARILSGDIDAFKEVMHLFESWYHLMVSILLFTDPCIKENNLSTLCVQCIEIYSNEKNGEELKKLDSIIMAAFNYDLMQVIQESCLCFDDNWWFATHFIDLLYNSNQLDSHQIENSSKFRESFVIDYANSLMTHNNLWTFAIEYLHHCPQNGTDYIYHNLESVPLVDDSTARKVINVANKLQLFDITKSISVILSRRYLSRQKLGLSLIWAIKSGEPSLTNHIANIFLTEYDNKNEFPDEDVLSNLGTHMLVSDRLTFLAKYYEFHQLKRESQLNSAADLLVSLLVSHIAPKFFIPRLIVDSLPLLETQNIVLNLEQTSHILSSLEDLLSNYNKDQEKGINIDYIKEREDLLRLAIARNLARAFI